MEEDETSEHSHAKERWQILRTFIKDKNLNVQHKRRHVFGLFTSSKIADFREVGLEKYDDNEAKDDYNWIEYICEQFPSCCLAVRQRVRTVNWNDAIGFDNTGNICVWPSEEILAYLCIKNSKDFKNKTVCELGAGMTGLAGMMLAIASDVQEVLITDGNLDGVTNLKDVRKANKRKFAETKVQIRQLRWDVEEDYKDYENYFDYVLCADCLLYEQVHENLLDVMNTLLKSHAIVLIVSPHRGLSVERFIEKARKLFDCEYVENFDEFVWSAYCQEKKLSPLSEAVRNFPALIKLKKR